MIGIDACVLALKSRNVPADEAVRLSVDGAISLRLLGARPVYFKYCSTFDSTADGNIGPVADALLELCGQRIAVVAPGYPANGRTVYQRHLFVGPELLSQSGMQHHPLTPMHDSNLVALLEAQSVHRVGHVPLSRIRAGELRRALTELEATGVRHAVVDTVDDDDLVAIAEACSRDEVVTGSAGLASAIAHGWGLSSSATSWRPPPGFGGTIAGSCAEATRRQVAAFAARGPAFTVDPWRCVDDPAAVVREASQWASDCAENRRSGEPFLIASCADAESLRRAQKELGAAESAAAVERVLGRIALAVVERGVSRLLVAGGETSGAVIQSLSITRLEVKRSIGPGLAWCETDRGVALALKSGNFGADSVFADAHRLLEGSTT